MPVKCFKFSSAGCDRIDASVGLGCPLRPQSDTFSSSCKIRPGALESRSLTKLGVCAAPGGAANKMYFYELEQQTTADEDLDALGSSRWSTFALAELQALYRSRRL